MSSQIPVNVDSSWTLFIDILSDEFLANTGFGIYAHINLEDIGKAYQQYRQYRQFASMRRFARDYVRHYNV